MPTVYTHIASNKRKSALMVLLTVLLALGIGAIFAFAADYGPIAIYIAAAVGVPSALIGSYAGDKIALAVNGAQPVELENNCALCQRRDRGTLLCRCQRVGGHQFYRPHPFDPSAR